MGRIGNRGVDLEAMSRASASDGETIPGLADLGAADPARARAALEAVYERYKDELFGFLIRLLKDRTLAEDALQESFVRVAGNIDRFDRSRPFRPWIYQIARNVAIDTVRRRHKDGGTPEVSGPAAPADEASADAVLSLARAEQIARARAALEGLPAETRALLVQRHGLGMKLDDLAASLSCTERTVRNRLKAAADVFTRALLSAKKAEGGSQ